MIRDTFFDLHRFVDLCRKEMIENWKTYILRFVMVYGVMAIILVWNGYFQYERTDIMLKHDMDPIWRFESWIFLWGFIIFGCISASFAMERMKTKTSRTVVLMTPATMFEKFFSRWLIATCGFIIVFLIAFKMADWTRLAVYMLKYPDADVLSSFPLWEFCMNTGPFYENLKNGESAILLFISGYCFIQSFFLLGSTVWPKHALIKTFSVGVGIVIVYILVAVIWIKILLPDNYYMPQSYISEETVINAAIVITFVLALFNWVLAYFRFKESEIINRW